MTHAGYILAAYLITALVLLGLVAWVLVDLRAQQAKLACLEERGIRRRSEQPQ
jgi:heme exporter protein D